MPRGDSNNKSLWAAAFIILIVIGIAVFKPKEQPEAEFFAPPIDEGMFPDVRNEGTEHEFIVAESVKPEVEPDLSLSTISVSAEGVIDSGTTVRYTIDLFNSGNSDATGMDVFNELDISFNLPLAFNFDNCGDNPNYNAEEEGIEFSSVTVKEGEHCIIDYDVTVKTPYVGDYRLTNNLYISPAAEGGEEIGPLFSDSLVFGSSYTKKSEPAEEISKEPTEKADDEPAEQLQSDEETIEDQIEQSLEEPAEPSSANGGTEGQTEELPAE
jgi:uncharacterized repeat protein (TIGR01451 family)